MKVGKINCVFFQIHWKGLNWHWLSLVPTYWKPPIYTEYPKNIIFQCCFKKIHLNWHWLSLLHLLEATHLLDADSSATRALTASYYKFNGFAKSCENILKYFQKQFLPICPLSTDQTWSWFWVNFWFGNFCKPNIQNIPKRPTFNVV